MAKRRTGSTRSTKRSPAEARNRGAVQRKAVKRKAAKGRTAKSKTAKSKTAKRKIAVRAAASRATKKKPVAQPSRLAAAAALVRGAAAGAVVAVAERLPWAKNENDPIVLLEADHRRFEDLMKAGEETTSRAVKRRTQLLETLTSALNVHELIEEKILYPALKPHAETHDIVLEGYQEHHVADLLVKELHTLARDDEKWGAKFKVLHESLDHHIEEEEGNMFRSARAVLSREELNELGARMRALKADLER